MALTEMKQILFLLIGMLVAGVLAAPPNSNSSSSSSNSQAGGLPALQERVDELSITLNELLNEIGGVQTNFTDLTARMLAVETQNSLQQGQIAGLLTSVAALQDNSSAQQAQIDALEAANGLLSARVTQLETVNAQQTTDIANLQANVASLQQADQQLLGQISSLTSIVQSLQANESAQDQRIDALTTRLDAAESSLQSLTSDVANLSSQISSLQNLPGEVQNLQAELTSLQGNVSGLTAQLAALGDSVAQLQACCDRLTNLSRDLQTLQGVVQSLGGRVSVLEGTVGEVQAELVSLSGNLSDLVASTSSALQSLTQQILALQNSNSLQGSVFVRWGRNSCPSNSNMVSSGVTVGKDTSDRGSSSSILCMGGSLQPNSTTTSESNSNLGRIFPGVYGLSDPSLQRRLVPCVWCYIPRVTMVVPGATSCPGGWEVVYDGRMVSPQYIDDYSTDFLCLDNNAQSVAAGGTISSNAKALRLFLMGKACGGSGQPSCSQGMTNELFSCVVCSKIS